MRVAGKAISGLTTGRAGGWLPVMAGCTGRTVRMPRIGIGEAAADGE